MPYYVEGPEVGFLVLVIKCSACKRKLWKYEKFGQGEVLRCHKERIAKLYGIQQSGNKIYCLCGKVIGIDKGSFIKMVANAFTYRGIKINK